MSNFFKKKYFFDYYLKKKIDKIYYLNNKRVIKTWSRRSTIIPEFVGFTFLVHNGNKFLPVKVNERMIGHKLGEFSYTRTFKGHPISKQNKKY